MEKKALKTSLTLPPNVHGRRRGRLSLCLHEINWQCDEPFQFNWIQAKLIWWGDKYQLGAALKLKNKKNLRKSLGHAIHYNISTKLTLFRNYLRSSQSVEVKFSSGISNIDIGRADLPIPVELIEFLDKQSHPSADKTKKFRKKCYIFNAKSKIMGELLVEYDLILYDRMRDESDADSGMMASKTFMHKQKVEIENDMNQFNLDLDLDLDLDLNSLKKKSKTKSPHKRINTDKSISTPNTKLLSTKTAIPSPLLNYLTGRPLADDEKNKAVNAMRSTSPTESLIDLLSYDLNGLYLSKKANDAELNVLKKIDCLRIRVYDLCLSRAGTREILSKTAINEASFSSGTFTVDIDLDSILSTKSPFEKNMMFTSKVTRIFSSSIESLPSNIAFNRSSVHKLNAFCIKSRSSYANGIILLTVRYRDIESSESHTLGTARVQLADVIQASNLTFHQQCIPVTTTTSQIIIGQISLKIELGCRGLHFGSDFLEAISSNAFDEQIHSMPTKFCNRLPRLATEYSSLTNRHDDEALYLNSHDSYDWFYHKERLGHLFYETCVSDIHDNQTDEKSDSSSTLINIGLHSNDTQKTNGKKKENIPDEQPDKQPTHELGEMDGRQDENGDELKGLFHIGQINYCDGSQLTTNNFLVCRPFWSDSALVTENCKNKTNEENYQLNYLELFSVICDDKLFESTKHGFMSVEVWTQNTEFTCKLIGLAKVPLHQFFIAFNNNVMRNHISQQELPVISIDGWVTISSFISSNLTPVGTVQAILAVGSTKQINNLKMSKGLLRCGNFLRLPLDDYPYPTTVPQSIPSTCESNQESNTKPAIPQFNDRNSNFAAMFSNFIDTLASRLPDRNATETAPSIDATTQTSNSANYSLTKNGSSKFIRPTSELLDELQRALAVVSPPIPKNFVPHAPISAAEQPIDEQNLQPEPKKVAMFRVDLEIESALHLPSMAIHVNKKSGKRNRNPINKQNGGSSGSSGGSTEIQPSAYATFEAAASATQLSLLSYATNIVEHSCSPLWNKHFDVFLPVEFLLNDEKRFEIRVWRKIDDNLPKTRLIPNSSNDVTIGLASVDLSVLLAGLPTISGYFNIIDHAGCINGQIEIHIKPKDDITIYQKQPKPMVNVRIVNEPLSKPQKQKDEPSLEVASNPIDVQTVDDSALSRALKRKFTELEEISKRLRARLFDVTGNMSIDPEDQFENDLNTIPDEDDDFEKSNIANEMSLDWLKHCQNLASPSTSSNIEFISLPDGHQSTSANSNQSDPLNVDYFNNKLNDRIDAVLNDKTGNYSDNFLETSEQNIAESMQKPEINEFRVEPTD